MNKIVFALLIAAGFASSPAFGQAPPNVPAFSVLGGYKALSVTATTGNAVLPVVPATAFSALTIYNSGTKDAFFALGGSTVTATTSSIKIGAGVALTFWVGSNTYVAAICGGSDSTTLDLYQASGPLYFARP
jgi:hypothetical protein